MLLRQHFFPFFSMILLTISLQSFTQEKPIKLKKIDKKNLEMDVCPADSSADAMIICDYGWSGFEYIRDEGFKLKFERHVRKKIFNKNGFDEAEISIPLYNLDGAGEDITYLKGYTYNLEKDRMKRTRLKNSNVHYEEKNDNLRYAHLTFPRVKEGSIIEVRYTINSDFFYTLRDWQFQHEIPVKWSEYIVEIPEYFHYNHHSYGHQPYKISEKDRELDNINITQKYRTGSTNFDGDMLETHYRTSEIEFWKTVSRWVAEDLPAFKEEPFTSCPENYMNRVEFELARINFPRSPTRYFSQSWESIREELYGHADFGRELKKPNTFLNDRVKMIRQAHKKPKKRMQTVFQLIQNRMLWNSKEGIFTDQGLRKAWKKQTGNAADINLLLTVMLRKAGLDAHPVVLSTRDHGLIHPSHPSIAQTNHVISCTRINGQQYLMDATVPISKINVLPVKCLNGKGRLISSHNTKPVALSPNVPHRIQNFAMLEIRDDKIQGSIKSIKYDYAAYRFRKQYLTSYSGAGEYIQEIEKKNQFDVQNYEIRNVDSLDKTVLVQLNDLSTSTLTKTGDRIYMNPIIYNRKMKNPFTLKQRNYPVDYGHSYRTVNNYQITIPGDYKIESLPSSRLIRMPGDGAKFLYSCKKMGKKVIITNVFLIQKTVFLQDEYKDLKDFYDRMIKKQAEQIVLKKTDGSPQETTGL